MVQITDSLNRTVSIEYDVQDIEPYGLCDRITYNGFGGIPKIIRVSKKNIAEVLRSGYTPATIQQLFGVTTWTSPYPNRLPSAVWLPDGQSYKLFYNQFSELARVELPAGGAVEYDYDIGVDGAGWGGLINYETEYRIYRRLVERRVYPDGASLSQKTTYSRPEHASGCSSICSVNYFSNDGYVVEDIFDGQGNRLNALKHYFYNYSGAVAKSFFKRPIYYTTSWPTPIVASWKDGKEYKTELLASDGTTVLRRIENDYHQYPLYWWTGVPEQSPANSPKLLTTTTTFVESGLVSMVTSVNPSNPYDIGFDQFNNKTDIYEYDFGNGQPGPLLRRTHTDYVTISNYLSANIVGLPLLRWISSDAAGNSKVALIQFEYDNYGSEPNHAALVARSNVTGFDSANYGTGNTVRGNVTAVTKYANAASQSGAVTTYSQYDILGNVVKTIDENGNAFTMIYSDNFGLPDSEAITNSPPAQLSGLSTFAFPTSTINPDPQNWTAHVQYDYFAGVPVNTQDVNGAISKTLYNDNLDRPTQSVVAIGTTNESQVTISYHDSEHYVESTKDLNLLNDNQLKTRTYYDGLGRTIESRQYEANGNYRAVQTQYDSLGRPFKTSHPFRPTEVDATHPILWTETSFDDLGRTTGVETPDGASTTIAYDGNRTLTIDQAGKRRVTKTNANGQLKEVWEITPSDAWTESVSFPNQSFSTGYKTTYSYDAASNLLTVNQGSQTRTFTYNHLSKLLTATGPEAGTVSYTYDPHGNLKTKRDARNIKTVFDYDSLNRVTKRCYRAIGVGSLGMTTCVNNSETPEPTTSDVTYTYDSVPNSKGRLTKVQNINSTTEYVSFDSLGRITRSKQTTDGVVYGDDSNPMTYSYNLAGALVEQKYPSGRVVKNVLDNGGNISIVESKKNANSGFWHYADSIAYNAAGVVKSMQLGNGYWESTVFNSRLQPKQIALGTVQNGTDKLKLEYSYGDWNGSTIDATKNNGNIVQQVITAPSSGSSTGFDATQKYYYDSLNRIDDAKEEIGGSQTWRQDFTYDRYGNRNFIESNTSFEGFDKLCNNATELCPDLRKKLNPSLDTANNRLLSGQNYTFDSGGNITADIDGRTFVYDGENKQVEVRDPLNNVIGQYIYDGDGRRIKKVVPNTGETTVFVYDASARQIAEYSTIVAPETQAKVSYLTSDNLGTPRINTDANGIVTARHDYHPFGEETSTTQRLSHAEYNGDGIRKKFTGYERDTETELDFAQARMYGYSHGRFTSPDPTLVSVNGYNPQSWNRYAYVLNNPYLYTDPLGLWEIQATIICEQKKDGSCDTYKNGKIKIKEIIYTARKTKPDDNGASLAKQLGLTGKDAEKFAAKVGNSDNIRLADQGGIVGRVFDAVEDGLARQGNYNNKNFGKKVDNPGPTGDDCSETCIRTAYPDALPANGPGVEFDVRSADDTLRNQGAKSVQESDLRVGDVVRWEKNNDPTHFANFIFRTDSGDPLVYSKSGATGPFEIAPINGPGSITEKYGSQYGTVQGIGKKDTGYYRP